MSLASHASDTGREPISPMAIAHHDLFTTREKIELLQRLRAEVTGALENELDPGLSPAEVDAAIEDVRQAAGTGSNESGRH